MKEFPRRFLSLRDKNGKRNGRANGGTPQNKSRTTDTFRSIFKNDSKNVANDDFEEEEDEATAPKVEEVQRRLEELHITNISTDHIKSTLASTFAGGDPVKTAELIDVEQKALSGTIIPYSPDTEMVGAENRGNVSCYLDALLFAMFCRLDAFECMLSTQFEPGDHRNRLSCLLRTWVNMLRSGKLIGVHLTELIQDAMADCGWSDARVLEQQDTSEAFAFLTETLQLPLLSLQVDLFHQGKGDKDDHKVVYERLLNLAIPEDTDGTGIQLEDCLEEYFNAQVDVTREGPEGKKKPILDERRPDLMTSGSSTRLLQQDSERVDSDLTASPVAASPQQHRADTHEVTSDLPANGQESSPDPATELQKPEDTIVDESVKSSKQTSATGPSTPVTALRRPSTRARSASVIQNFVIDESGRASSTDNPSLLQNFRRKRSTIVKGVTIPAWQFFRLIPWHSLTANEPKSNTEVAMNFDQRPVVGICLKRYAMTDDYQQKSHNTYIDIPDVMRLPRFMLAEDLKTEDYSEFNTAYKLVLQSVVCHRGDSLQSGHYIAFARVDPKLLTDNRRHDFDPPPDYEEARWVRFDDLELNSRVTYVDDIKSNLKAEMPYLLFYQVVPTVEVAALKDQAGEPPSYNETGVLVELPPTPTATDAPSVAAPSISDGYFDRQSGAGSLAAPQASHARHSFDVQGTPRTSIEGGRASSFSESTRDDYRRQSIALTESTGPTPAVTPDAPSPAIAPVDGESPRQPRSMSRFSRARSSRPTSQSGEKRMSLSISRLGGLMRPSKDSLAEPNTLNLGGSTLSVNGAGDVNGELNGEGRISVDAEKLDVPLARGHRRGKSKEKLSKEKNNQPDRECTVM